MTHQKDPWSEFFRGARNPQALWDFYLDFIEQNIASFKGLLNLEKMIKMIWKLHCPRTKEKKMTVNLQAKYATWQWFDVKS